MEEILIYDFFIFLEIKMCVEVFVPDFPDY